MKSILRNFLLSAAGIALSLTAASAAPWGPPAKGDLILGVQATGGTGATTNVLFNMGPAHALRDNPSPGILVNLNAELVAAFGDGWASRTDLFFGVFANRSNATPSGLGSVAPENGDPARTIYASKGTALAGASTPWSGFSVSSLGLAATSHAGQIEAIDDITANGNNVATLEQGVNPVQWNNGWSRWNPVPGAAFSIFTGGIQSQINATAAIVDLHRIVSTSGTGSYVTSITLAADGNVSATAAGAPATYFQITPTVTNGSIAGAGGGILYASGSVAKLTATPASGFGFTGWGGDASGTTNPFNLTMNGNKNVTANFAAFPTITTPTSANIGGTFAGLGGNVTDGGGATVTERGVVYSINGTNSDPLIDGSGVTKATVSGTTGVFTVPVTGLAPATTYAFKAFATSAAGTTYTSVGRFTTNTAVDLVSGIGNVTGRQILAGDTQSFTFTLGSAAQTAISALNAATLSGELFDSEGNSVAIGSGNFALSELLEAGTYTLRMTAAGSGETFSLNFDASNQVTVAPSVTVAPASIISKKAKPVSGTATIRNNSPLADTFRVSAGAGNGLFGAAYFDGAGANVTAALITGTFETPSIDEGSAPVSIRAAITPNKKKLIKKGKKGGKPTTLKKTFRSIVRATSSSNPAISAAGQFSVTTK
jgi:uncharacterized repeat protein (TIGR02543 family)